ncbi:MAG TPA: class II fructose-bisphosphate aldolase [Anaerolineae bacterium]|nr:class II fructose-bisphosphate aldolase [Anaerolineae bacterium]HQK14877.1 class II fructose-bisphosphate aldolase [Anaerolineae bacterium]
MALVSIFPYLKRAQQYHYALPLFDMADMYGVDGLLAALEEKRASAIIAIYAGWLDQPNIRAFAAYIRTRAEAASVPVSLMLDHGGSFEQCIKAIAYGFTDVMYDGSRLPLEENIANTRAVVRAAHAVGLAVEAELGHVGSGSEYQEFGAQRKGFTNPDDVERFVAETGVDILAIAIGTAHGLYAGEPHLDLDLLREIRSRVDIPLALHGGSGCSDEQFRAVIAAGITKINVATDLFVTTARRLTEAARAEDAVEYFAFGKVAVASFQERCGHYLDVFGATGNG